MKIKHILLEQEEDSGSTAAVKTPNFRSIFQDIEEEQKDDETDDDDESEIEDEPEAVEPEEPEEAEESEEEEEDKPQPLADEDSRITEAIRKGFEALRPVAPDNKTVTPAQMSPEDEAKVLGTYRPQKDFVDALFDPDLPSEQRVTLVHDFIDKTVRNALQSAAVLVRMATEDTRKEIQPIVQRTQAQTAAEFHQTLETKYPQLKGKAEVVEFVAAQLKQQGFTPRTIDEAIDAVGKQGVQFLKKLGVTTKETKARKKPAQLAKPSRGGVSTKPNEEGQPAWANVFKRK